MYILYVGIYYFCILVIHIHAMNIPAEDFIMFHSILVLWVFLFLNLFELAVPLLLSFTTTNKYLQINFLMATTIKSYRKADLLVL